VQVPETRQETSEVPGGRRREESEQRRRRILAAARECFGERGYAGSTVAAIAARAGVSNGLLYQFFDSKEHLLRVVLGDVIRDWVRAMLPRDDPGVKTASQALEAMLRRSVAFCRSNPLLPALLSRDRALQLQRIRLASSDRVQPHRQLVAAILRDGIASGEFRADLDVASTADIICQLHADYSGRAYRREPDFPDTPELIDATVRFIHDAVRAR
jgi:AcrR family transcriptional regulator